MVVVIDRVWEEDRRGSGRREGYIKEEAAMAHGQGRW
jgi:hypothetical protein